MTTVTPSANSSPDPVKVQLADWFASVGRAGALPLAPGTWGSLLAVGVWYATAGFFNTGTFLLTIMVLGILGVVASGILVRETGIRDPGRVVIDEYVGQWIALIGLPRTIPVALVAFLSFRLFDILKPGPVRTLEKLPGGWGVMADDVGAGVLALACTHIVAYLWL